MKNKFLFIYFKSKSVFVAILEMQCTFSFLSSTKEVSDTVNLMRRYLQHMFEKNVPAKSRKPQTFFFVTSLCLVIEKRTHKGMCTFCKLLFWKNWVKTCMYYITHQIVTSSIGNLNTYFQLVRNKIARDIYVSIFLISLFLEFIAHWKWNPTPHTEDISITRKSKWNIRTAL